MKYYYKGYLVRESKTRSDYTYALLRKVGDSFRTIKCSAKYEEVVKEYKYRTKADKLAKQDGITINEAWAKYRLLTSQRYKEEDLVIAKLEVRA